MAESTAMVTGIPAYFFTPLYTGLMIALMARASYRRIAGILKWMTLVLFAYVIAAFLAEPDWSAVWRATLIPHFEWSASYLATFVAILGTTISPYLFFWQANQEVEERRDQGKAPLLHSKGSAEREKRNAWLDVATGMLYSNAIMYFIILTTGATLNVHGQTHIATTREAAEALRPLAGHAAYLLFSLGIIGTGMLSVPVLAGSTAYAIAEGAQWRHSLKYPPARARHFYTVLTAAFLLGMGLNYAGFGVVGMLFWSAAVNGVLASPLIVLVVLLASDRHMMGRHAVSTTLRCLGWLTAGLMTLASLAMFATLGKA
jgi:Mn2+/Fe2+ NRAMP family transporter